MSRGAQSAAKNQLINQMQRSGFGFGTIPLTGVGIGEGAVVVVIEDENVVDHPDLYGIPNELDKDSGFENLPVYVEYGGLYRFNGFGYQGRMNPGGGGGVIQGGVRAVNTEPGTCFGVLHSVSNPNQKFAVVSTHITSGGKASCTIGVIHRAHMK